MLHTGADLPTDKQITRLKAVFASDEHVEVEATWNVYQRIVAAYRHPDRAAGKRELQAVIDDLTDGVPKQLKELITLGRTLKRRPRCAGLFRPPRHQQRPDRGDQRPTRAPPRHRAGLPQPCPLRHPRPTGHRRIQNRTTPSSVKSRNVMSGLPILECSTSLNEGSLQKEGQLRRVRSSAI